MVLIRKKKLLLPVTCLLCCIRFDVIGALPDVIPIAALFDGNNDINPIAFRSAVEQVNNAGILHRSKLEPRILTLPPNNSYQVSKEVCDVVRNKVAAIFGPQSTNTASSVQSICDALEIPHIETRSDFSLTRADYLVNLHPHPSSLSKAYVDVLRALEWKFFTIVYEDFSGLVRLEDVIQSFAPPEYQMFVKQLSETGNYRPLLRDLNRWGVRKILLEASSEATFNFLKQAQQVGMLNSQNSYILTSLDFHTLDLEDFLYASGNITGFRIVNPERDEVQGIVEHWKSKYFHHDQELEITPETLTMETALIYDSVLVFAKALRDLDNSQHIDIKRVDCDGSETTSYGYSLMNYMNLVEEEGLTGHIKFDTQGFRTQFQIDVIELLESGVHKVGFWTVDRNFSRTGHGIVASEPSTDSMAEYLANKTLIITTKLTKPYAMLSLSTKRKSENERFEGFGIDLIEEISRKHKFNYQVKIVSDDQYGNYDKKTGKADGMVKELMDGTADVAIADFTITEKRQEVVDFTKPFLNLGISILYVKPQKQAPDLFSFMAPFSNEVWYYMAAAFVGVSLLLYVVARFSPYEWDNPYPCIEDPDELENQFSLLNSFWFTIGSLMQQGSDVAPKAVSSRMIAAIWWFFTLIMISSYTANLAACLTVENVFSPINNVYDLPDQTKVKYGVVRGGSTYKYFEGSNETVYQKIHNYMEHHPEVFKKSNDDGVEEVKKAKGGYAFFMESVTIDYAVERECELAKVGAPLDSKGYGIAFQKGSNLTKIFSATLLNLTEKGIVNSLVTKWWKEKRGGGQCNVDEGGAAAEPLGFPNLAGVFAVLMLGNVGAMLLSILEFLWETCQVSKEEKLSFWKEAKAEMKFICKCRGSSKPARKSRKDDTDDEEEVITNNFSNGEFSNGNGEKIVK